MTILVKDDVVGALTEDIGSRVEAISALKKTGVAIYSPDQIMTVQQRLSLPCVLYHYAGMPKKERSHDVVFFIYLICQAQSTTSTKSNKVINDATKLLQELRKAMRCAKSVTGREWVLDSELPDLSQSDKLIYQQRWSTSYQITN